MCAAVDQRYAKKPMRIRMATELARRYAKGIERRYRTATNGGEKNQGTDVPGYPHKVVGLTSHTGSLKIWMTPDGNAVRLQRKSIQSPPLAVEKVDRSVKIYGDLWCGLGFLEPAAVFTNDKDLT